MEEDLTTDLMVLQSHFDGMLDRIESNNTTLRRFQVFEMGVLELNSLAEMLEFILGSQDFFKLDYIGFCLVDAKNELKNFLIEDGFVLQSSPHLIIFDNHEAMKKAFGVSTRPYTGACKTEKWAQFFVNSQKLETVSIIPLLRKGNYLGALCFGSSKPESSDLSMPTHLLEHMASILGVCLENHLNYEGMTSTCLIDPLTGVNNRRFLEQRLIEEIDRAQRSNETLTCFFLDLDYFKQINDTYGHQVGDQVLMAVAQVIRDQVRNNDVIARYGGEEFIALLSNTEESKALDIAQRIRKKVKELTVDTQDTSISVTISIGCATYKPEKRSRMKSDKVSVELIKKADQALYKAKKEGRDRVVSVGIILHRLGLPNLFK